MRLKELMQYLNGHAEWCYENNLFGIPVRITPEEEEMLRMICKQPEGDNIDYYQGCPVIVK